MTKIDTIVFDIGNVLIDWNPRRLYAKLFPGDEAGLDAFLNGVCTMEWHGRADAGLGVRENVRRLKAEHPGQAELIEAWDARWPEMFGGPVPGTAALVEALDERGLALYAITNYPADKFPSDRTAYPVLDRFKDILVSCEVGLAKPDPAIFHLAQRRFGIDPAASLFIDDNAANIAAARRCGFHVHHFHDAGALREDLTKFGLI